MKKLGREAYRDAVQPYVVLPGNRMPVRREMGLEIVGWEIDSNEVVEHIKELRPDMVLLDRTDPTCDPMPVVMRILRDAVGTGVIAFNLKDNTMCVSCGERRTVTAVDDLVLDIEQPSLAGSIES